MVRRAAINSVTAGASSLWAGITYVPPGSRSAPHHHGELESLFYVIKGAIKIRWGEKLEFSADAGPGDLVYIPPFVPHEELNLSTTKPVECLVVRSNQHPIVVDLDIKA
jgi:uncharacterized RmlC-like cupin family protein